MSVRSFKTGVSSASMRAGNTPEHHTLLSEIVVGAGGAASITFSNIDQSYQHLEIRSVARCSNNGTGTAWTYVQFNGDTNSNYSTHLMYANGTNTFIGNGVSLTQNISSLLTRNGATAGVFSPSITNILDYSNPNKFTTIRCLNGDDTNGAGYVSFTSGLWMSQSAVTSILIKPESDLFMQHSRFSLYGVK